MELNYYYYGIENNYILFIPISSIEQNLNGLALPESVPNVVQYSVLRSQYFHDTLLQSKSH